MNLAQLYDPDYLGIYIHVPWCIQKCSYCDFYSVGIQDNISHNAWKINKRPEQFRIDEYEKSIIQELNLRRPKFQNFKGVNTIYFGGGTASILPIKTISKIINSIENFYNFSDEIEITVEGNPENFSPQYLNQLHNSGITRINVGIQTWNTDHLKKMNRFFDSNNYLDILENLNNSKINNIGADLIYGFPQQDISDFKNDLKKITNSRINHLSIYSLTVESRTQFGNDVASGACHGPEETMQSEIFKSIPATLGRHGFSHYEVSNFAQKNSECRHNLRYWLYEPYMGLGPGAHGFTGEKRYGNVRNIALWQKNPVEAIYLDSSVLNDFLTGYLRLTGPLKTDYMSRILKTITGFSSANFLDTLNSWKEKKWIKANDKNTFQWTMDGLLFLDDRILELTTTLEHK